MSASSTATHNRIGELERELGILTLLLQQERRRSDNYAQLPHWFARVHESLYSQPRWWVLLAPAQRRAREFRRLKRASLFDAAAYLERYPDVRDGGLDPLDHYMLHGINEARTPLPDEREEKRA